MCSNSAPARSLTTIPHICSMLVNHAKCETSKSDSQLCQICQACELHKNVLNFSRGTQRRDTTALEEAFEFKARYKGGVRIKCQCYGWSKEGVGYIIIGTAGRSCTKAWCTLAQSTKSWVARDIGGKTCELRKSRSLTAAAAAALPLHCCTLNRSIWRKPKPTHCKSLQNFMKRIKESKE